MYLDFLLCLHPGFPPYPPVAPPGPLPAPRRRYRPRIPLPSTQQETEHPAAATSPPEPPPPGPGRSSLPRLLCWILCTCVPALVTAQIGIYEPSPPVPFDTTGRHHRIVRPGTVLQFLGARCGGVTEVTATEGIFRFRDAHQYYPQYDRLPLDVYFQPPGGPVYYLSRGRPLLHITLLLRYVGTYYAVIRDRYNPSVLIVNSATLRGQFLQCCALHYPIDPQYLNPR